MIPYTPWCCNLKSNKTVPFETLSQQELPIGEWETVNKFTLILYEVTEQNRRDEELHRYNFEALFQVARWKLHMPGELVAAFNWYFADEKDLVYILTVYRKKENYLNGLTKL